MVRRSAARQALVELRLVRVRLQVAAGCSSSTQGESAWCLATAGALERAITEGDVVVNRPANSSPTRGARRRPFSGNAYD